MLPQGGNGGFCLRRIDAMIALLSTPRRSINVSLFLKGVVFLARNRRFDLLRIFARACRGVLRNADSYQRQHNVYEDAFISIFCSFLDRNLSVAPASESMYFALETNPSELLLTKMKWRLPFAVHGYDKYFSSLQEFDSYRNNVPRNEYSKRVTSRTTATADSTTRLPRITVVTATYNIIKSGRLEMFRQCVESVHNQTYRNIEHLIIDGASNDGTLKIVQEYVDKGWCICYSEKDDGPWDAMYRGQERATGEFLNILNSDDYFCRNDAVEIAAKALAKGNADWFFSDGWFVREDGTRWNPWPTSLDGLFGCMGILHQSVYVRTDILRGMDAFRSKHISRENYLMMLLYVNGFRHAYSRKKLICYREGGFSSDVYVGQRFVSDFVGYLYQNVGRFWGLTEQECGSLFGFGCFADVAASWRLARKLRMPRLRAMFLKRLVLHAWKNKQLFYLAGEVVPLLRPITRHARALKTAPRDSVERLLASAPDAFVPEAYRMILGRDPDPCGLEHYGRRLRQGASRLQLMAEIRLSPEGRRFHAVLPGLDSAIRPYRLRRLPLIGLVVELFSIRELRNAKEMANDIHTADGRSLFTLKNKEFVYAAFKVFLGRDPEPSAVAHYTKALKYTRARTVLLNIALSEEAVAFRRNGMVELDRLKTERDTLLAERDALRHQRNTLRNENYGVRAERDALLLERDVMQSDLETMRYAWNIVHNDIRKGEPDRHSTVQAAHADGRKDPQKSLLKVRQ